ncbi:MAG: proton-conducting transporter membrane subunit [Bacillota bacterium]|nr:proton-conducting transporter membrane subunit [Bacillota bacterium]
MINYIPILNILILILFSFIMMITKNNKSIKFISLTSNIFVFFLSIILVRKVLTQNIITLSLGDPNNLLGIEFFISNSEAVIGLIFTFVMVMILWYSKFNLEKEVPENRISFFYILINVLLASLLGVIYSNDLFNSYVFIEVSTLSACGIIILKDKKENIKATVKYLIMSTIGSGLVLMAIAYIYSITGHLNITNIHEIIITNYQFHRNAVLIILGLFTVGLGIKSAVFPLHSWLPDAHSSAPTPASAALSALVIKVYVFMLIKILFRMFSYEIVNSFIIMDIILLLGSMGMIFGSIMAIMQKELKRMVAYSSVAQMGYIVFGIGLGTISGTAIAIYHIIGHAVTKSSLFLISGLFIDKTGSKKIEDLKGIGREMPLTLGLFTLGAFSMVGIPILPGFISKWYLSLACIEVERVPLILIILASSLLNVLYYFPIIINGYFGNDNLDGKIYKSKKVSFTKLLPVILLVLSMVVIGGMSHNLIEIFNI